ncbi:MAG: hypothetical protein WDW38_004744 [Sanguina aurantia]
MTQSVVQPHVTTSVQAIERAAERAHGSDSSSAGHRQAASVTPCLKHAPIVINAVMWTDGWISPINPAL